MRLKLPDPTVKHILIVETDLALNHEDPDFNAEEYDELVEAVAQALRENSEIEEATVERVADGA